MAVQRLVGKFAIVSGVGSGIGQECALRFAREGATVLGVDIDAAATEVTVALAQSDGLTLTVAGGVDLTTPAGAQVVHDSATRLLADSAGALKGVDVLLNAAAAARFEWIEDLSHEDWRFTMAAEVDSVFLVTQAVWPLMKLSGAASVINFASANAHVTLAGSSALAHCAGKGAVLAMTRQLAMEGGPHGIRANTISPALILTSATRAHLEAVPGLREQVMEKLMIKRIGECSDVANLAVFLGSDEASWITASDFRLDGGATAW